jgi:hypothetical protein
LIFFECSVFWWGVFGLRSPYRYCDI